ncbi:MAG: hypothetical protein ACTSP6_03110 [Promethearchaeota archaeon]
MSNQKKIRIINITEEKIVADSLSKISKNIVLVLNSIDYELFILFNILSTNDKFPSIYLVPNNLIEIINRFESEISISSLGVYFGFIKKNQFLLSLEGAEFLNKLNAFPEKHHIVVNNEGEKSILYGNHIITKFLHKTPKLLEKNAFVLILNESNELISIGYSQVDFDLICKLKPKDIIVKNLKDKGYYLRKEQ